MCDTDTAPIGDQYNHEYFLQEDVCRLCWEKNAAHEIGSKPVEADSELKIQLLYQIQECLNIELTHECYPNKICNACYQEIMRFYKFKIFCQATNRRLLEIVQNHINKSEKESQCTLKVEIPSTIVKEEAFDDFTEPLDDSNLYEDETQKKVRLKRRYRLKPKRSLTYCSICRLDLNTVEQLKIHNSQSHGIEEDSYKCFGCEKRFKTRKTRLGHEINFCKGLKEGYRCSICDRCLPERRMYESHMRDHRGNVNVILPDKLFKCKQCYKLFKTRDELREHECDYKTEKKKYICESCGRVFTRQDYLHKHKLTHTGTKQHVCPHCDLRFTQRSSLIVHIRKHTGERPYSCDICPQRCISSSNLRAHVRRHLGLKKFECTLCDKKFGYKGSLEEHIAACHRRARHACHCGAAYSRARGLRRHLSAKHGTAEETDANVLLAPSVVGTRN